MTTSSAQIRARTTAPTLIGAGNALAVLGVPWATALRWARELGVPLLRPSRKKILIRMDLMLEALERRDQLERALGDDPAAVVRRALGR